MSTNWSKETVAKTETREFHVIFSYGRWLAQYQPVNPKTGKAWQSSRAIFKGGVRAYENQDFGSREAAVAAALELAK
jgi:hypothetical protein